MTFCGPWCVEYITGRAVSLAEANCEWDIVRSLRDHGVRLIDKSIVDDALLRELQIPAAEYESRCALVFIEDHVMIVERHCLRDNHVPGGCPGHEHPFGASMVTAAYEIVS